MPLESPNKNRFLSVKKINELSPFLYDCGQRLGHLGFPQVPGSVAERKRVRQGKSYIVSTSGYSLIPVSLILAEMNIRTHTRGKDTQEESACPCR